MTTHETIEFDVLFVGGGPANLAGAIRLMQLAAQKGQELEVALIDKGAAIGSHAISGAARNTSARIFRAVKAAGMKKAMALFL